MKSALLGHNNDALPRECFIHGEDKQSYGTPLWLEFHKDKKSSERIKSDLASNGKAIVIEKPSKKVEGEVFFECPLLFYTLQHSELSLMSSQKFWFSYFSFSYTLSNSFQYGLVADYTTEGNIKLSGRKVDDENIRIRNWIDDIELYTIELQLEEVYDINVFLNFTLDDKTVSVIIEVDNIKVAHFFKCVWSDGQILSLEKIHFVDLHSLGMKFIIDSKFNDAGDKIAISSQTGSFLVYSLRTQAVLLLEEVADFKDFFWSTDVKNNEMLVNFYRQAGLICVFSLNYKEVNLKILQEINVSDFLQDVDQWDKCLLTVSSGISLALLGYNHIVYFIDLTTGLPVHQLNSQVVTSCDVQNIMLNWCSNEIVTLYRDKVADEYFIQVNPLLYGNRVVESLFNTALKTVLLKYSINDLLQMNLPESIKTYFK